MYSENGEGLRSGLTPKAWLALIIAVTLFVPINIYTYLVLGVVQGTIAVFFITLMLTEIAKLSGMDLTKQETFTIYSAATWGGVGIPVFYFLVYRSYFVGSPMAWSYRIGDKTLAQLVPEWLVPKYYSPAHDLRTFFQAEFYLPLGIMVIWTIFGILANIFLAIMTAKIYVERLKFLYPFALVDSSVSLFLSERRTSVAKYFLGALTMGVSWGAVTYLPNAFGARFVPIPFADLTWAFQEFLPGALFGVATTLSTYFMGFMVPLDAATYMFITSVTIWIILNSLFITTFPNLFPKWAEEYTKGMGLISVQYRSFLRVWFPCQIGFMIAASLLTIVKARRPIVAMFREAFSKREAAPSELPSMSIAVAGWLLMSAGSTALFHFLIPEVPLWVPIIYTFGLSFLCSVILGASVGEMGFAPQGVYTMLNQSWYPMVYLTPYQGYAGFAFNPPLPGVRSGIFSQQVKAAYQVRARPIDLIKIWLVGGLSAQLMGLLILDFLWRVAPIPSSAYPYSVYAVLQQAYTDSIVSTRQLDFSLQTIFIPMIIFLLIISIGEFISGKRRLFFSSLGIVMGVYATPINGMAILAGSLLGRFLLPRFIGKEEWATARGYIVAGELSGEGLILMLSMGIIMIFKCAWLWPL